MVAIRLSHVLSVESSTADEDNLLSLPAQPGARGPDGTLPTILGMVSGLARVSMALIDGYLRLPVC